MIEHKLTTVFRVLLELKAATNKKKFSGKKKNCDASRIIKKKILKKEDAHGYIKPEMVVGQPPASVRGTSAGVAAVMGTAGFSCDQSSSRDTDSELMQKK